ncbi:MAG: ABC transporter permease, partial [Dokdonella sp.]
MSPRRLWAVVRKELTQLSRDRLTFGMIVGIPTLQLLLFGFAINLDIRHLPAAVLDQANTARSRELIAELSSSQVLDLTRVVSVPQQIESLMQVGEISAAVVVPSDFETRLERPDRPAWQVIVDGSDQSVQAAARQLALFPLTTLTRQSTLPASVEIVNFYNPERRAPVNTVPGLIGVILTMTMVIFTAMAI